MQVHNDTGLQVAWLPGKLSFPQDSLTLIVKGTFKLQHGANARLDPDDPQLVTGEQFYDDDPDFGCRYDGDFAYFKPRADALLVGTCHAPGGQPAQACRVAFGVGDRIKRLTVFGDRFWTGKAGALTASTPVAFTSMPLDFRRSYGGPGYAKNPVGKGYAKSRTAQGRTAQPLPNIESESEYLRRHDQHPDPVGFGPIGRDSFQRMQGTGTYDARWEKTRWPWFPEDYDWGCQNGAPRDQQIAGYLRGDEALLFENLHPEHATYRSQLPGLRVRCFVLDVHDLVAAAREVTMHLDTLWVDTDAEQLVLVWRGATTARSPKFEELAELLVVTEDLREPPAAAEKYCERLSGDNVAVPDVAHADATVAVPRRRVVPSVPGAVGKSTMSAVPQAPADAGLLSMDAEVKAEVSQALDGLRDKLRDSSRQQVERVKAIFAAEDIPAALDAFLQDINVDAADVKRVEADADKRLADALQQHGFDASSLEQSTVTLRAMPREIDRASAEARVSAGRSLANADLSGLNLSGAQLAGADLSKAILKEANLGGADLSGANMSGANLVGANLEGALLAQARLEGADLSNANLASAKLEKAKLAGALFDGADLRGAALDGVEAKGVLLTRANLTDATLVGALLESADLSGSCLDRARFDRVKLCQAVLGDAHGEGVVMAAADLTELRAGDGCRLAGSVFTQVHARQSIWTGAELAQADFRAAELERADFTGANLQGANLRAAEMAYVELVEANLSKATVTVANLFRANLKQANLTETDLRGSNCYEAEFWDAVLGNTRLAQTNLKMTKLADMAG